MCVQAKINGGYARLIGLLSTLILGGCGAVTQPDDGAGPRSTLNLSVLGVDSESTYYETNPNHELELAE